VVAKAAREVLPETRAETPATSGWSWAIAGALLLSLGLGVYFNLDRLPEMGVGAVSEAGEPTGQPIGQPVDQPVDQPVGQPVARLPAEAAPLVATAGVTAAGPAEQAGQQTASQPVSESASPPAPIEPDAEPDRQPGTTPAEASVSLAAAQSATLRPDPPVTPEPAAEPEVPPVAAPGPATLPAVSAVTQGPGLAELLAHAGPSASANAWAGLYREWGYDSAAVNDEQACAQAPAAGLRCMSAAGSWGMLQRFDRPAILLLVSGEGRLVPALMRRVVPGRVLLEVDGQALEVTRSELESVWYGPYRLLWQKPPSGTISLHPGARSNDVGWLRERLQRVAGLSETAPDPRRYDAGLKALVASFQRQHGLTADGVAGARTFILLNNLDEQADVPRLSAPSGGGRG
jgi:general secretion pathway protein A